MRDDEFGWDAAISYACPGALGPLRMAAGDGGVVFLLETSAPTAPGLLHQVGQDGVVSLAVNPSLPFGASDIARQDGGELFVIGTSAAPGAEHHLDALDAATGATLSSSYQGSAGFTSSGLAVRADGTAYLGEACCGSAVYQVTGGVLSPWGIGSAENQYLLEDAAGTELFVSSGTAFGLAGPGGFTSLDTLSGPARGLARDGDGGVYVLEFCESCGGGVMSRIRRYEPDGGSGTVLLESVHPYEAMAYDAASGTLVLYADEEAPGLAGCAGVAGVLSRVELP